MTNPDPLEQMLEQARATLAPSTADDARLRRALGLGPGGALPTASRAQAAEPRAGVIELKAWRALRAAGSTGILAGAMLAGLGFGAGLWLGRTGAGVAPQPIGTPPAAVEHASAPARAPLPASAAEPRATSPRNDGAEPVTQADEQNEEDTGVKPSARGDVASALLEPMPPAPPSPRGDRHAPRRTPSRARAAPSSGANEELALLRRVERALRAQNPALALALLAELDERFPDTRLAEEREAARVIASCGVGEGGARFRAERFSRQHGGSVYAERVREACATPEKSPRREGLSPLGDQ